MKPVVAAFDFDGTLCRGVSGLRFFQHVLGPGAYAWFVARRWPQMAAYGCRLQPERSLACINRTVFTGREAAAVAAAAEVFWRTTFPRDLFPAAVARLRAHLDRGDRCVIVSSAYELYLRPWAASLGIQDVLATRLAVDAAGRLTGEMLEPSCDAEHKRDRLLQLLGPRAAYELHAYGDRPTDFALLSAADQPFIRQGGSFQHWQPRR
ncbi:HAD-IB family hydrolase [Opitutus sp. ER46]|uniref:HAD-IB family hydrolase n=1 Tax=Opitutus sp. ER46 TaxID=2161864 RepID=UPI000D30D32A|nr:HAD-IB family hydrolase [Opitutus sp. ER46]PTX91672.1 hypothetical protein DB354_17545 [Opitutus sp. ER46]